MVHRDVEAEDRPIAPTDDRRLWDLEEIHQPGHIRGHQIVAIRLFVARTAPVAAAVHHDDAVALLQFADLIAPVIGVGEPAMQQDDRLTAAAGGIPDPDAVDGRIGAVRCVWQGWGRRQGQPLLFGVCSRRNQKDREGGDNRQSLHLDFPHNRRKSSTLPGFPVDYCVSGPRLCRAARDLC